MTITAAIAALLVTAVHLWLDRNRPHPDEFDDIRQLEHATRQRAAMRRATGRGRP